MINVRNCCLCFKQRSYCNHTQFELFGNVNFEPIWCKNVRLTKNIIGNIWSFDRYKGVTLVKPDIVSGEDQFGLVVYGVLDSAVVMKCNCVGHLRDRTVEVVNSVEVSTPHE